MYGVALEMLSTLENGCDGGDPVLQSKLRHF